MPGDLAIPGLKELYAAMDALPDKIAANIMRNALRAGAKVIAKDAAQRVHSVSGDLAASVRFGARLKGAQLQAYVRAGGKGKKGQRSAFYAGMVEKGTAAHFIQAPPGAHLAIHGAFYSSVHHPGAKKKPFMRPALDSQSQAALQAIASYARNRLATKHGIDVPEPPDPEAVE